MSLDLPDLSRCKTTSPFNREVKQPEAYALNRWVTGSGFIAGTASFAGRRIAPRVGTDQLGHLSFTKDSTTAINLGTEQRFRGK